MSRFSARTPLSSLLAVAMVLALTVFGAPRASADGGVFMLGKIHANAFGAIVVVRVPVTALETIKKGSISVTISGPTTYTQDDCSGCDLAGMRAGQSKVVIVWFIESGEHKKGQHTANIFATGTCKAHNFTRTEQPSQGFYVGSRMKDEDLEKLDTMKWVTAAGAAVGGVAATALTGGAALAAGAVAAVIGLESTKIFDMASDPPDPNYTTIATASPLPYTAIAAGDGLSQASADAFNALLDNHAEAYGYLAAALTSLERAGGAQEANDTSWEGQQVAAAGGFVSQAADLFEERLPLEQAVEAALKADGIANAAITRADVLALHTALSSGAPASWPTFGLPAAAIDHMAATLYATPIPDVLQDSSLYDWLGNPTRASAGYGAASALRNFSAAAAADPLHTRDSSFVDRASVSTLTSCIGTDPDCVAPPGLAAINGFDAVADDDDVLVTAPTSRAVLSYHVDPVTGHVQQIANACAIDASRSTRAADCAISKQLADPRGIALSADGTRAYVANVASDAVTVLSRDPDTGALADVMCVARPGADADCTSVPGLDSPGTPVLSPDGKNVYVPSSGAGAIFTFTRSNVTGALTFLDCVSDSGAPVTGCATTDGLGGASSIAISSDGTKAYATGRAGDSVVSFAREAATGHLTVLGCTGGSYVCGSSYSLWGPDDIVLSPDGKNAYVGTTYGGIKTLVFNATGTAVQDDSPLGCMSSWSWDDCTHVEGLSTPTDLEMSDDGEWMYAADGTQSSIVTFRRDGATGALFQVGPAISGGIVGTRVDPLTGASRFALMGGSDDGYIVVPGVSRADVDPARDEITVLARGRAPTPLPPRISIADVRKREGGAGKVTMFAFTVTLSRPVPGEVTVDYATLDGTATAVSDFVAKSGTLTFLPYASTAVIQVAVKGDRKVERNEKFSIVLSAPTFATITDGSALGVILNDDF